MTITYTDVQADFPEFASTDSAVITRAIARAYRELDPVVWGNLLDDGALYLVAHSLTVNARRGSAGAVTQESVGQVSRSFGSITSETDLGATGYGQQFERLQATLIDARIFVDDEGL